MATKKFAQMATKKLNALLETASDEDRAQIEAILAERKLITSYKAKDDAPVGGVNGVTDVEVGDELSPEEEAAIATAEANNGVNPTYTGRTITPKQKITDEERHALAEKLKENINHRCQAVPFNTAEWVDGYIAGVIEEKRSNKVLYAIKTDDGRRIVKVHDSNLIRIFDEVIEPERKPRAHRIKDKVERVEWTPEAIADEVNAVIDNVGKQVKFEKYRTTDENGNEVVEMVTARIVAIIPDKRTQRLLYRISVPAPVEGNPLATKIMHKVVTSEGLIIAPEFDTEGAELNAKYRKRREEAATRAPLTPQDRVLCCEHNFAKVSEKLAKVQEEFETKKKQLEEAKAELDKYLAVQQTDNDNEPLD